MRIIDKETWEAVHEELKRWDAFMEQHGIKMYTRGMEPNLYSPAEPSAASAESLTRAIPGKTGESSSGNARGIGRTGC